MRNNLLTNLILSLLFVCVSSSNTVAQNDSSLIKRVSKSFCDEFSKKDPSKINMENMEMELGLIILPVFSKYADEIEKEWGFSNDEEGLGKFGEKIGQDAAINCPSFQAFIMKNLDAITELDEDGKTKSISGDFISVEPGTFSSILIKNKTGKEEKLWWFEFFEGADDLVKNAGKLKAKPVTVQYKEMEIFDATLKEYRKIKVITKMVFN